ncbi:MAG: hypothetical protein WCK64_12620 [Synechococcaceae cyanobacterium ELA445]
MVDQLDRIEAHLNLKPAKLMSPYLPLDEAAEALRYPSPRALRTAIKRQVIPPQYLSESKGPKGLRTSYRVNVTGYLAHLGGKGRR